MDPEESLMNDITFERGDADMTMTAHEPEWQKSFHRVASVLPVLTQKELDIIGDVATEFVRNSASVRELRPLSEDELWARIDYSLEQADRGEVLTLEETMASIDREFGL